MFSSNAKEFNTDLMSFIPAVENDMRKQITRLVQKAHISLIDKTPVHTGRTVRNYILTMDSPFTGSAKEALSGGVAPGRTSAMSLGSEPRRAMNKIAALGTQTSLDLKQTPFRSVWISNNTPEVDKLELGLLPSPARSRSSGMLENTFMALLADVGAL